jgi:hypothetical protein
MARAYGKTQDGKMSQHALAAVGPRRFLIVEFDFSEKACAGATDSDRAPLVRAWRADGIAAADACAALLAHLAEYAPLTLAVHSGNKSVHGWFYAAGRSDEQLRPFMAYAHALGADPATWSRHQFVRMPDGTRENGQPQIESFEPAVVIIDPWSAAVRDDKAKEYLETFDAIRRVIPGGDAGPAIGIVAHTRKPHVGERASGRALLNLLAGSHVLGSVPRCVFVLQSASAMR